MFNLAHSPNKFLTFYSNYLSSSAEKKEGEEQELDMKSCFRKEQTGTFTLRFDEQGKHLLLSFLDKSNQVESLSFQMIERDVIQASNGQQFDNILHLLDYYQLKNLFQQEKCWALWIQDIKQ